MRLADHPILGKPVHGKPVTFDFDGRQLSGFEGEPIAAALRAASVAIHRYTKKYHSPRGIFCAIGRCTDCVMVVNGRPNVRTCVTPLEDGMTVRTQYGAGARSGEEEAK
ncbi:MAG: (2Fe-2S)-binding protein [Oscillospiraceae bacterium]|jgi:predicted molibdopterin-dependent oxidoreductase YjgC|nr:(2Fe-2S)-binding protein [Oscillospiraceae bacterium]